MAQLADGGNFNSGAARGGAISRMLAAARLPRIQCQPAPTPEPPPARPAPYRLKTATITEPD